MTSQCDLKDIMTLVCYFCKSVWHVCVNVTVSVNITRAYYKSVYLLLLRHNLVLSSFNFRVMSSFCPAWDRSCVLCTVTASIRGADIDYAVPSNKMEYSHVIRENVQMLPFLNRFLSAKGARVTLMYYYKLTFLLCFTLTRHIATSRHLNGWSLNISISPGISQTKSFWICYKFCSLYTTYFSFLWLIVLCILCTFVTDIFKSLLHSLT
jgi:hypothetical protein